ncbi:MAG: hypothetical protein A3C11_03330 [Candidatus Sungbacteria bacterium RIFCSPHIGHO2_02_FULL_49_12]|uniref:phosphomannomutase n=1 Tax=Candidatus Sungbacteria bacterium RIFCSPHIGHO2_02_FULL_49_12 TaxID=1802271 RepID=A0A1G2KP44_9BACT|nr:MAG: hypothetical protein A3C11_03330 [Candidatus Sungbacteria bacterium RIFCSPHIGHO2_02_FULL_49_12]
MVQVRSPDIICFDIDDTLAESKSPLDFEMASLICQLLESKKVAVISGGAFGQFQKQILNHLTCGKEYLKNLYLLPTNGAILYEYHNGWREVYCHEFTPAEKQAVFDAFEKALPEAGFQKPDPLYGVLLEDRRTQITFSALGSEAPLFLKKTWDPDHTKRERIVALLRQYLPDFSVSIGGTTSIDVTRKGIDKAYGLGQLMGLLGESPQQMVYVGDALFPGGNDASVVSLGVHSVSVADPGITDTKQLILQLLAGKE